MIKFYDSILAASAFSIGTSLHSYFEHEIDRF